MNKRTSKRRNERGQAIVELALTLPLLIMVFAGIVHFGFAMREQQVITNASRVAARRILQTGGTDGERVAREYCQQAGLNATKVSVVANVNTDTSEATATVTYQYKSPTEDLFSWVIRYMTGGTPTMLNTLTATTVMRF